jgi:group I intron endonuclease
VGSATNLSKRFRVYYSQLIIEKVLPINRSKSHILNAILKYGYSKFTIEILEYCDSDKCLEREQYYIDLLNPEYNILKTAGSSLGNKHTEETRTKMSSYKIGDKNPMFGKTGEKHSRFGKLHTEETRSKMSDSQKAVYRLGRVKSEGAGRPSQKIEVLRLDIKNNITTRYDSITAAALALNIRKSTIANYFARNQKFYKNQYAFKKL